MRQSYHGLGAVILLSLIVLTSASAPPWPQLTWAGVGLWTSNGPYGQAVTTLAASPAYDTDDTVFAGTDGQGIFISADRGLNWTVSNTGLTDLHITAAAVSGNFARDQTLFVGTDNGVFKSTNAANEWTPFSIGITDSLRINALALQPDYSEEDMTHQTLFVGTDDGVFRSTNGGSTWTLVGLAGRVVTALALSPAFVADETLLAGVRGGEVFTSMDGGTTWLPDSLACLTGPDVLTLAYSPNYPDDGARFAGTSDGTFKIDAAGCRKTHDSATRAFAFRRDYATSGTLYAATVDGVWVSGDRGETWQAMSDGLDDPSLRSGQALNVHALIRAQANPTVLFAGTNTAAWQYTVPDASTLRTLILTNRRRLLHFYGLASTDALLSKLYDLASRQEVLGLVIDLGDQAAYPEVVDAYASWEAQPTTANANTLATAVRNLVLAKVQEFPNIKYLVIVGGDPIVPFYRVLDRTATPEQQYRSTNALAPSGTISTTVLTALDDGYTLSDDYYASLRPAVLTGGRLLYTPDLAVGRLVETPEEMEGIINAFIASPLIRSDQTAFVSGYDDYLIDGAGVMAYTLGERSRLETTTLIGNDWTVDEERPLLLEARHDVVALNQHGYHNKIMTPLNGAIYAQDVVSGTADLTRALVVAVSCHAGLNVADASGINTLDVPQSFARKGANFVGNTGFGWAMLDSVGLTEALASEFLRQLSPAPGATVAIGEALRDAKRAYYLSARYFDAYDEKVVIQFTLYGLPMFEFSTPATAVESLGQVPKGIQVTKTYRTHSGPRPTDATVVQSSDVPPGLTMAELEFTGFEFLTRTVGNGTYFALGEMGQIGEGVQSSNGKPLMPGFAPSISIPAAPARGAIFAEGAYRSLSISSPVTATSIISDAVTLDTSPTYNTGGWYPSIPHLLNQLVQPTGMTEERLVVTLGEMGQIGGGETIQRLFDQVAFEVYYSNSADQTAPVISAVTHTVARDRVTVSVEASDTGDGLWRVVAVSTPGQGQWLKTELQPADDGTWTGQIPRPWPPLPPDSGGLGGVGGNGGRGPGLAPLGEMGQLSYFIQAVDRAGNVTIDDNGQAYYLVILPSHTAVLLPVVLKNHPPTSGASPTPTASATPTRHPSPTPTASPTPTLTPIPSPTPAGSIYGTLTYRSTEAAGVTPWLRVIAEDDEEDWQAVASTVTDDRGRYRFTQVPALEAGKIYQAIHVNMFYSPGYLWAWLGQRIDSFAGGGTVFGGSFDLADIPLGTPDSETITQTLPVTFTWTMRTGTPTGATEGYRLHIFDPVLSSYDFLTPDLGHVDHYVLTELPPNFRTGTVYNWDVHVVTPGGEGESLGTHKVLFGEGQ